MKIFGYIIKPEREYRSLVNDYEEAVAALRLEVSSLKAKADNAEKERSVTLKQFEESKGFALRDLVKRGNIIEHILYTLKNKPKLDRFNWDKEYIPFVERLEKIARGEMNK